MKQQQVTKNLLAAGGAKRMHLEWFPGDAPDLNPAAGIWKYLKRVELKNHCCRDGAELRPELQRATARLRHRRATLQACARQCGYSV